MNGDPTQRTGIPIRTTSTNEVLRSKNKKRDDAIRKKVELELTRRTNKRNSTATPRRNSKGTVSSLRPNPAIVIFSSAKIIQAAQLMAAKRTDAVLAVNEQGDLVGILTDKDIAFRVVAEGLDVRMTSVQDVMTKDPIAVFDKGNRNEALNIMISRRFRHLPVISEGDEETEEIGTSVVGLLDITKCVFERLDDLERKVLEDQSIISAMEVLERRGTVNSDRVDHLRIEHECPDIETVLKKGDHPYGDFPSISVKSSVREAAKTMKLYHSTAVLVLGTPDGDDKVGGIFTTKDIVLRVIAASLDPNTTSVIRCMTPHPDFVTPSASILDALKKLHAGHFLHLPVIDNTVPVGLIDVMTLTIAMITYLVNKTGSPTDQEGPMWNSFWNSTFAGDVEPDRVSQHSESRTGLSSSVYYRDRQPVQQPMTPEPAISERAIPVTPAQHDGTFTFKLRDMTLANGKMYRFNSPSNSFAALYERIIAKTGYATGYSESDPTDVDIITPQGISARLCYLDDEGDIVSIESDKDLEEAVQMALALRQTRLMIYLGDPPSPQQMALASAVSPANSVRSASPNMMIIEQPQQPVGIFEQLKDAPLPVNVAISAGIVVVAFYFLNRIARS